MFRRCAYRKIDQLTPIVSQTEQTRNCGAVYAIDLIVKAMVVSRLGNSL
jgi:hypothetical protein